MKSLPPSASLKQRTVKKVSKPVMEKRRRERINQSLEALRLLMVENTNNERLENPKVEKAEILESVVQFLKTERPVESPGEPRLSTNQQYSYSEGVRSCLLQVSHFIASRSQEAPLGPGGDCGPAPPGAQAAGGSAPVPYYVQSHYDSGTLVSPTAAPVWRPWPQTL